MVETIGLMGTPFLCILGNPYNCGGVLISVLSIIFSLW